jgi:hypothetical protein
MAMAAIAAVLMIGIAGRTCGLFRARQAEQAAIVAESKERTQRQSGEIERRRAIEAGRRERQQRKATEAERDRAERQLANGLLRPIGFSSQGIDPAELHSFVDWSAIKESPLKMHVLEIAFENPESALRVARRAERVVQACVGLSPIRRTQAIELVSARQRDLAADPRIRAAACWLALELGSNDLPAWAESWNYLSEPPLFLERTGYAYSSRFSEFVGQVVCSNTGFERVDRQRPLARLFVRPIRTELEMLVVTRHLARQLQIRARTGHVLRASHIVIPAHRVSPNIVREFRLCGGIGGRRRGIAAIVDDRRLALPGSDPRQIRLIAASNQTELVEVRRCCPTSGQRQEE